MTKYDKLTNKAISAFQFGLNSLSLTLEEASESVARIVGSHAAYLGMSEDDLSKWLQKNYGRVWVKETGLRPTLSLKEVRDIIITSYLYNRGK